MKKFIAILMTTMLVLSLCAVAFAEDGTTVTYTDATSVTVKKLYKLVGAGTSPTETFTLTQVNGTVEVGEAESAPALGTITGAVFEAGDATADGTTKEITINLPTYNKVGIYEYTLREVVGSNAGVAYYDKDIRLVVTVINDGEEKLRVAGVHTESKDENTKTDTFENTYSAGTLNVAKTVTGNLGDKEKYFEFNVSLTGVEGKTYGDSYAVTGGSETGNPTAIEIGTSTTFKLKHGETLSIANLPYGVDYTVTETSVEGYTTTMTGNTGIINAADQTAAFTNKKDSSIDTGISTDSLPYVLLLGIVVLVGAAMFIKRSVTNH